jgi:hypothetical protein
VAGHQVVVAGDDLEGDALVRQRRDRLADVRLGRVAEEDHALEGEVALEAGGVREVRFAAGRGGRSRRVAPRLGGALRGGSLAVATLGGSFVGRRRGIGASPARQSARRAEHPEATATSRKPSADEPLTSLASRSCSALWIGRAVWSSRTLLERRRPPRGALRDQQRRLAAALDDHAQHPPVEVVGQLGELLVLARSAGLGAPARTAVSSGFWKLDSKWLLR